MTRKPEPMTEDEFLQAQTPGTELKVKVLGPARESFLKKASCAYFEWVYGERVDGKLASYSVGYHSEEELQLEAGGKSVEVSHRRIRAYLQPSFEKEYQPGDKSAPDVVAERAAEEKKPMWTAEYCLEVGKTYVGVVHEESFHLPPAGPGQKPRSRTKRVLRLTDRALVDGKPQGEATPVYRHWRY